MPPSDSSRPLALPDTLKPATNHSPAPIAPPVVGLTVASPGPVFPRIPPILSEISGAALLQALRRRWLMGLGLGLAAALIVGGFTWLVIPTRYTATALVHVATRQPAGFFAGARDWESNEEFVAYKGTQSALLKSRPVLHSALRQVGELGELRHHGDPILWLEKEMVVDSLLGPEVIRVTLTGNNAEDAAKILNAVVDAYLEESTRKEQTRNAARRKELQENYRNYDQVLRQKRSTLRDLEQQLDAEDPATAQIRYANSLQLLMTTKQSHIQARLDLQNAQVELAAAKLKVAQPSKIVVTEAAINDYLRVDPGTQGLYTELNLAEADIRKSIAVTIPGPNREAALRDPLARKVAALDALKSQREESRPTLEQQLRAKAVAELQEKISTLESQVEMFTKKVSSLDITVKEQENDARKLQMAIRQPDKPLSDLDAMRADVLQTAEVFKKVGEQLELMKVEPRIPSRVTLLESADVPRSADVQLHLKLAGLSAFAAFGLCLFGVSWQEFRTRKVHAVDDVVQGLGLNLLGTLPDLPVHARRILPESGGPRDLHWMGLLTESVDAIRTLLLHAAQSQPLRIIMVTSAVGGEGKTSLASHLATSLARSWRKTLLIDCDLRNPGAHQQFDLALEPGFSEVLRGEVEFDDAVRPTPVSRLWMLPAGQWDDHAIQALAQENVRNLFEQMKEQFDFIIVDASSVLPVADTLSLGQHADGVILSVLREVSRTPAIYAAYQRLATLGIRVLGTVFIGTKGELGALGYQPPVRAG